MPERTEDAALRGVLPLTIGGEDIELRTLTLDESDEWLESLAEHLAAVELPDTSGQAAIRGALVAPAASARELLIAYDRDGVLIDRISSATKRELKVALDLMIQAEDPFGEGVARSVAEALGAPSQRLAAMIAVVLNTPPPDASTTGHSPDTASTTGPSGATGPASSSSSGGPTPLRQKKSA